MARQIAAEIVSWINILTYAREEVRLESSSQDPHNIFIILMCTTIRANLFVIKTVNKLTQMISCQELPVIVAKLIRLGRSKNWKGLKSNVFLTKPALAFWIRAVTETDRIASVKRALQIQVFHVYMRRKNLPVRNFEAH